MANRRTWEQIFSRTENPDQENGELAKHEEVMDKIDYGQLVEIVMRNALIWMNAKSLKAIWRRDSGDL